MFLYFKEKKYTNYFNFDFLFLTSFLFANFIYPVFYYTTNPYFSLFKYSFNENLITEASAVALIGGISFMIGGTGKYVSPNYEHKRFVDLPQKLLEKNKFNVVVAFTLFIAFLLTVGSDFLRGNYEGSENWKGISIYLFIIFSTFLVLPISLNFYKKYLVKGSILKSKSDQALFLLILVYLVLFLYIGDRGGPLQLMLVIGFLYSFYIKPISFKQILVVAIFGAVIMNFIASARVSSFSEMTFFERGLENFKIESYFDVFSDIIITNRNLYDLVDYTCSNGFLYGYSYVTSLLAIVPFFQGFIVNEFDLDPTLINSAYLTKEISLGSESSFGVGTNLIGDIYVNFGLLGVVVLMFVLGDFAKEQHKKMQEGRFTNLLVYLTLISFSVYLPRTDYFFILRPLVWLLLFYKLEKILIK